MECNNILKIIGEESPAYNLISNMSYEAMELRFLEDEVMNMIRDGSPWFGIIKESNKVSLCKMLLMYHNKCSLLDFENEDLKDLVKYGSVMIYSVETPDGVRDATMNEIKSGVEQLVGEYQYPITKDCYRMLRLLMWTYYGENFDYKESGYKLKYDSSGKVEQNTYSRIEESGEQLIKMFNWVGTENYYKTIRMLKKLKKGKGYKYADYDSEEIVEDISVKQLVMNIKRTFPTGSSDREYRRALALSLKDYKWLEPLDIAFMRKQYKRFALDKEERRLEKERNKESEDLELKNICETLLENRYKGLIDSKSFAFKIIGTLKSKDYSRVSDKQYAIVKELYDRYLEATKVEQYDDMVEVDTSEGEDKVVDSNDCGEFVISDILNQ